MMFVHEGWSKGDSPRAPNPEPRAPNPQPRVPNPYLLFSLVALLLCTSSVRGEDTVYVAGSGGGQVRLKGEVLDYTGSELTIQDANGRRQSYPAERVLRIETHHVPEQTAADELYTGGKFEQALGLYGKALDAEPRRWVRRQIVARIVRCYSALDRPDRAGEQFLLLVRDDPAMLYFDCIPLAWIRGQRMAGLESAAAAWLGRPEEAARLLGASHLLLGNRGAEAARELRALAAGADPRVAALATAQTWRAVVATATDEQIDGWALRIEQMPESLAGGPYYVLARALAQRQRWQQAALASMRVAILYPQQRPLAAQSLVDAGRALEKLGQPKEAVGRYREAMATYPEQMRAVSEAQSRLDAIQSTLSSSPR